VIEAISATMLPDTVIFRSEMQSPLMGLGRLRQSARGMQAK
jgi:hypothetical protein